jgi:hypothetical protein
MLDVDSLETDTAPSILSVVAINKESHIYEIMHRARLSCGFSGHGFCKYASRRHEKQMFCSSCFHSISKNDSNARRDHVESQ